MGKYKHNTVPAFRDPASLVGTEAVLSMQPTLPQYDIPSAAEAEEQRWVLCVTLSTTCGMPDLLRMAAVKTE